MQLGVFPLPIFLLPGGATRLRIFEPRYVRLVKEAASGDGFALAVYRQDQAYQSHPIAARVTAIDFATLDGGLLGVTVQANELVKLSQFVVEEDGLRKAEATPVSHWQPEPMGSNSQRYANTLHDLFQAQPELASVYMQTDFRDPGWVCGRFLELLPIPLEQKLNFYEPASFPQACQLIETLLGIE